MTAPCVECGAMNEYRGHELMPPRLASRSRPATRCIRRLAAGELDPACCYAQWKRRMSDEGMVQLREYQLAVRYLQQDKREPPHGVHDAVVAGPFGDQWLIVLAEWKRRLHTERVGRSEEVE